MKFLLDNRREFSRSPSGYYRRRYIVDLIIEADYRKVFIIPPSFGDYLVPLNVTRYWYLLTVPQAELIGFLVAQELTIQALVIEFSTSSLHMVSFFVAQGLTFQALVIEFLASSLYMVSSHCSLSGLVLALKASSYSWDRPVHQPASSLRFVRPAGNSIMTDPATDVIAFAFRGEPSATDKRLADVG